MNAFPQPDPLGRYLIGSLGMHAVIAGILIFSGLWNFTNHWGSQHASSGSVGVSIVRTIPIPRRDAPENPLANDTKSDVPQAPAPVKTPAQVKAPEPKAIEIPDQLKRKVSPKQQSASTYRPKMHYDANQVYSQTPQAANSKMFGTQGAGGVDIGPASVLGTQCGAYVDLMRSAISQKWNTADLRATPSQKAAVSFTIAHDGSVSNVEISHGSGNFMLDASVKRAVLDASLPPLTAPCNRNQATVELWFQLNK